MFHKVYYFFKTSIITAPSYCYQVYKWLYFELVLPCICKKNAFDIGCFFLIATDTQSSLGNVKKCTRNLFPVSCLHNGRQRLFQVIFVDIVLIFSRFFSVKIKHLLTIVMELYAVIQFLISYSQLTTQTKTKRVGIVLPESFYLDSQDGYVFVRYYYQN